MLSGSADNFTNLFKKEQKLFDESLDVPFPEMLRIAVPSLSKADFSEVQLTMSLRKVDVSGVTWLFLLIFVMCMVPETWLR